MHTHILLNSLALFSGAERLLFTLNSLLTEDSLKAEHDLLGSCNVFIIIKS